MTAVHREAAEHGSEHYNVTNNDKHGTPDA
jgi:hypothetical protein